MAIWQYGFIIIPKSDALSMMPFQERFDDSILWKDFLKSLDLINDARKVFPEGKSWNKDVIILGDEVKNNLNLVVESNVVTGCDVRFNLQSLDFEFIKNIIDLTSKYDLVFLDIEKKVVESSVKALESTLKSSRQYKTMHRQ
jgi:hypothetical protein